MASSRKKKSQRQKRSAKVTRLLSRRASATLTLGKASTCSGATVPLPTSAYLWTHQCFLPKLLLTWQETPSAVLVIGSFSSDVTFLKRNLAEGSTGHTVCPT